MQYTVKQCFAILGVITKLVCHSQCRTFVYAPIDVHVERHFDWNARHLNECGKRTILLGNQDLRLDHPELVSGPVAARQLVLPDNGTVYLATGFVYTDTTADRRCAAVTRHLPPLRRSADSLFLNSWLLSANWQLTEADVPLDTIFLHAELTPGQRDVVQLPESVLPVFSAPNISSLPIQVGRMDYAGVNMSNDQLAQTMASVEGQRLFPPPPHLSPKLWLTVHDRWSFVSETRLFEAVLSADEAGGTAASDGQRELLGCARLCERKCAGGAMEFRSNVLDFASLRLALHGWAADSSIAVKAVSLLRLLPDTDDPFYTPKYQIVVLPDLTQTEANLGQSLEQLFRSVRLFIREAVTEENSRTHAIVAETMLLATNSYLVSIGIGLLLVLLAVAALWQAHRTYSRRETQSSFAVSYNVEHDQAFLPAEDDVINQICHESAAEKALRHLKPKLEITSYDNRLYGMEE